jgi:SAM-dependent methyltransferase
LLELVHFYFLSNILGSLHTGTGFFCFVLAEEGHQMVGIDLTSDMIDEARKTSDYLNIPAEFHVMDAENPDFVPGSFDAIVTRNLTWALPNLAVAYKNWHKLLKSDGILINFDADYCREDESKPLPPNHAHKALTKDMIDQYESMKDELRPFQQSRPDSDVRLLTEAGFKNINVDTGVWYRVYNDFDEFYNPTPIFTLTAQA